MSRITANYDETWKEAVSLYLPSFLSFFFPQVYQLIDWTKTPESQEQEVRRITSSRKGNKHVTDKIFKVWLLQDPTKYFYLHIEIQCQYQANFSKRLYIYNYRIYNIDFHNVLSLVILGDNRPNWRPNSYQYEVLSNEVTLNFHSVKLLDYKLRWAELEKSNNIFAIIIMAHLKTLATTRNLAKRAKWKWAIIQKIYERGFSERDIVTLFNIIDSMMALSKSLQADLIKKVNRLEQERIMPLVSPSVQLAKKQGEQECKQDLIIKVFSQRFGVIEQILIEQIRKLSDEQLEELTNVWLTLANITELERWLQSRTKSV
jgi:hypothetical protein